MQTYNWLSEFSDEEIFQIGTRFWDRLSKKAYPLTHGALRVPVSLEPFLLTASEYRSMHQKLLLVVSAAKKLAERYFDDAALQELLDIDPVERDLIEAARKEPFVGVIRADLFWSTQPKLVELNSDFPDGLFMHDVTAESIAALLPTRPMPAVSNGLLFRSLLEERGISPDKHIFIGYNEERTFIDEFALTKERFQEFGWNNVSYGPIEKLEYKEGKLFFEGKAVDVIRRGAELSKLRSKPEVIGFLKKAQANGSVMMYNNFKMRLMGHKALLAALHDERFGHYLSQNEREAVQSMIPHTALLSNFSIAKLLEGKNDLVLKPSDLTEGEGVVIGSSQTPEAWEQALQSASLHPRRWLIQKKAFIPEADFMSVETKEKSRQIHRLRYDLCPHIFLSQNDMKIGNMLARFSSSEILNVMKGGGITYAFVKQ